MARWERDPKARRNLAMTLAGTETVVLMGNFLAIFSAYVYQFFNRVMPAYYSSSARYIITGIGAVALLVFLCVQGFSYVKGRPWATRLYVVENLVLVGMGVVWFAMDRVGAAMPDRMATVGGLLVPILTLFPLLWPLLAFKPAAPALPREPGA